MKRRLFTIVVLVVVLSMLTAQLAWAAAPPKQEQKKLTIALSLPDLAFPFFVFMEAQVKAEAEKLGNIEIVTLDGQNQVPKQTADMEAVIVKKYDGVLISPITAEGMAPAVQQVVDAGIPVVTIDRTVVGVPTLAHVGADNVLGGEQQGLALLKLFPQGATIFELTGEPGSSPAIDRSKGLHNIIDARPEIKVACQQTARFRREMALSVTESCLGATPQPDAVITANDEMAFGAIEALKARNLAEKVVVIGYDALPEALVMVRDGQLYGTIEQFPGEQSRTALRVLVKYLREGVKPPQHDIFIPPKLITRDNLMEAERIGELEGAQKPLTIALSLPDLAFPFFVFMEAQVKAEAEKLGNIEIVTLDGQNQVPKQTADMEAVIVKKYDGVLISPITAEGMAPAVQQVVDAGIPVVTIDRTVVGVPTLAHVGADNVLGGEQQGLALLKLFPQGATIFELTGEPGSSPAIDRSKGLHNIIDARPEIKVACQQTARFRREMALSVTESCLGATPQPDAVITANDEMAFGAIEALKARNLAEKVVVIGYDALPEALVMVRDGQLYGTIEQFPGEQSRTALRVLVGYLRFGVKPSQHDIFIPPKLITKENLEEAERIGEIQ
jgi:ABC-type sugar transport system substrate-binding protein